MRTAHHLAPPLVRSRAVRRLVEKPASATAGIGGSCARLAALLLLVVPLVLVQPIRASERVTHGAEDSSRWRNLGNFRGSASSELAAEAANFLFSVEQEGDLYQDLGSLSLGIGVSPGDFDIDWDNAFSRRVQPLHEALPVGSELTADDLSRYYDIQSTVSRVSTTFVVPQSVTGDFGVGLKAERGWEIILARARQPLVWGDRPLQEVLAERRSDDFRDLSERPPLGQRDLIEVTSQGIAAVARSIGQGLTPSADTEVGKIFYENIADPVTLLTDVGIPVPAEMFTASDPRLSVGDRVRQITFVSVAPLTGGIGDYGLSLGYEIFARLYRETTIVKEPDNHALVSVRHVMHKGHEFLPLKVRPEIRLLRIIKLGYTLFEQRFNKGRTGSSGLVYRLDLDDPDGRAALDALLGEGTNVRLHPLRVAAERGNGAELLGDERRLGQRKFRLLRLALFSPLKYTDRKTVFQDRVTVGGLAFDEIGVARMRDFRKRFGRRRDWKKQFVVSSQGNLRPADQENAGVSGAGAFAVNLLTGYRNAKAEAAEVRRQVVNARSALGPHPLFDELAALDEAERTAYFATLRISFGAEQMLFLEQVQERDVWVELAEILLGEEHADAWATAEARKLWRKRKHRRTYEEAIGREIDSLPQPSRKRLGIKDRFQLARSSVENFSRVQKLIRDGRCMPCLSKSFDRERHIVLMQILAYRLISEGGGGPARVRPGDLRRADALAGDPQQWCPLRFLDRRPTPR